MVEQALRKRQVVGSIPTTGSNFRLFVRSAAAEDLADPHFDIGIRKWRKRGFVVVTNDRPVRAALRITMNLDDVLEEIDDPNLGNRRAGVSRSFSLRS